MKTTYKHIFGPVTSRRLGKSIGIELMTPRTCSIDCVFCQAGRTASCTVDRREYIPLSEVFSEIDELIAEGETSDYLTLSGTGEPTLHSGFGEVLKFIKGKTDIPTAVLSNGSLFTLPEVRSAACNANLVKVSLSAWDQESYERINRPHSNLKLASIIEGYKAFRAQFNGTMWIEVFMLEGINSSPKDIERIAAIVKEIAPDLVHINTVVRDPAEDYATAVSDEVLQELAKEFSPIPVTVIDNTAGPR